MKHRRVPTGHSVRAKHKQVYSAAPIAATHAPDFPKLALQQGLTSW
jgi:hypothetical protein